MQAQRLTPLTSPHPPPEPPKAQREKEGSGAFGRIFGSDAGVAEAKTNGPGDDTIRADDARQPDPAEPIETGPAVAESAPADGSLPAAPPPGPNPVPPAQLTPTELALPPASSPQAGRVSVDLAAPSPPVGPATAGGDTPETHPTPASESGNGAPAGPAPPSGRDVAGVVITALRPPPEAFQASGHEPSRHDRVEILPDTPRPAANAAPAVPTPGLAAGAVALPAQPEAGAALAWKLRASPDASTDILTPPPDLAAPTVQVLAKAVRAALEDVMLLPQQDVAPDPNGSPDDPSATLSGPQLHAQAAAPGGGPAPVAPTPALPHSLGRDLSAILSARPDGPVEISLAPVELGRLRLQFWHEGDQLRVMVQAEHRETLDLLRRNGDQLLQEIRASGFAGADLSFASWGHRQDQNAPPDRGPDAPLPAAAARPEPPRPGPPRHPAAGLDLRY